MLAPQCSAPYGGARRGRPRARPRGDDGELDWLADAEGTRPLVLELPDDAWFDVSLMQKDIRLALEAGGELDVPSPSARAAYEVLTRASELGYGHRDIAAMFEVLAEMDGWPAEASASGARG
jgi:NAD-binding of NADP-dependent 3-hydroxyisobutyrate dehydrogenase